MFEEKLHSAGIVSELPTIRELIDTANIARTIRGGAVDLGLSESLLGGGGGTGLSQTTHSARGLHQGNRGGPTLSMP